MDEDIYLGTQFRAIELELEKQINRQLNPAKLSNTQMILLGFLRIQPDYTTTQNVIQDFLGIAQPTAVRLLRSMEQKGFIKCTIRKDLGGKKQVTLLQTDPAFWDQVDLFARAIKAKLQKGFTQEELVLFDSFLKRAYANLTDDTK